VIPNTTSIFGVVHAVKLAIPMMPKAWNQLGAADYTTALP
jgi:hypothetical protein